MAVETSLWESRANHFPEIVVDKISNINGMDVTFVTSAKTDKEAYELLKLMGIPFKK